MSSTRSLRCPLLTRAAPPFPGGVQANDLALRLAEAATGRRGVVCVDAAYHGHTRACIAVRQAAQLFGPTACALY